MPDNDKPNLAMVSLLQFIGAILVMMLHCKRLFELDSWHFIQKSMLSRLAVPYFMVTSSYFLRRKMVKDSAALTTYLKRQVKTYLAWSLLYLPYALYAFWSLGYAWSLLLPAFLVGLFYLGLGYQLWYLPAYLFGLVLISSLWQRLGRKWTGLLAGLLYLIGSAETYTAYLGTSFWGQLYQTYASYFLTSRNGLFYAPIFVCLGFLIADYSIKTVKGWLAWSAVLVWFLEGWMIFQHQGQDKNFFLSLPILVLVLVCWSLRTDCLRDSRLSGLKPWSSFYFFSHVYVVELLYVGYGTWGLTGLVLNRWVFVTSLVVIFLVTFCYLRWIRGGSHGT